MLAMRLKQMNKEMMIIDNLSSRRMNSGAKHITKSSWFKGSSQTKTNKVYIYLDWSKENKATCTPLIWFSVWCRESFPQESNLKEMHRFIDKEFTFQSQGPFSRYPLKYVFRSILWPKHQIFLNKSMIKWCLYDGFRKY